MFGKELHTAIGAPLPVDAPCFHRGQDIVAHDVRVGQKSQEAHFADAAKDQTVLFDCQEPLFRKDVVDVAVGGERDPDVDVRQEGHRS